MKKIISILSVFIFAIFGCSGCNKTDSNLKHYLTSGYPIDKSAITVLPPLASLPEYKDAEYQFHYDNTFGTQTMYLVVTYSKQNYENEKAKLDGKFTFLDHSVKMQADVRYYLIPEYDFMIDSYHFSVISGAGGDSGYPHYIGFIATSDEKCSIAYLYLDDESLDYISDSQKNHPMEKFIKENFKFPW